MSTDGVSTNHSWTTQQPTARQYAYLFCDLVNSTGLKAELNSWNYVCQVLQPHDEIFRRLLTEYPQAHEIKHLGDGFLAVFGDVRDAVAFALRLHVELRTHAWQLSRPDRMVETRIGIDVGTAVIKLEDGVPVDVFGSNVDVASRVMSAADGGRTLLTLTAFELARAALPFIEMNLRQAGLATPTVRLARHGAYRIQGVAEPVVLCEACLGEMEPRAPVSKHPKIVNVGDEDWLPEPTPGEMNPDDVPDRPGWKLVRKLGEGGFGRAYLGADSRDPSNQRVFKFCHAPEMVSALQNERDLLQRIQHLKRPDIVSYLGAHLDRPPYFLEFEYVSGGNLVDWALSKGGLAQVDFASRLQTFTQIAAAVSAAHRERVFHLDLKPSNILMENLSDGAWRAKITDFGIGVMEIDTESPSQRLSGRSTPVGTSERTRQNLYVPPEGTEVRSTTQPAEPAAADLDVRDVYALGVLLFQLAVGDLRRPLAPSALRQVTSRLLQADIEEATHYDPRQRLSSAAELEQRIRNWKSRERRRRIVRSFVPACLILLAGCLAASMACAAVYGLYRTTLEAKEQALAARAEALKAQSEVEHQYQQKLQAITGFWRDIDGDDDLAVFSNMPGEVQQLQLLREIRVWLLEQAERDLAQMRLRQDDLDNQISYARLTLRISQLLDDDNLDARERRLQAGAAALKPAAEQHPDHPALRLLLSDFDNQLGQLAYQRGAADEALARFEACLQTRRRLLDDSRTPSASFPLPAWEYDRKYLSSLHNLALVRLSLAEQMAKPGAVSDRALSAEAEQHAAVLQLQEALDGRARLAAAVTPPTASLLRDVASSRFTFGRMFRSRADTERAQGRADDAKEWLRLARQYYTEALQAFVESQQLESSSLNRQRVVETLRELVDLELEQGNFAAAADYRDDMVRQVALALPSTVRDLNARAYFTQAKYSLRRYRADQRPDDLPLAKADLRLAEHLYQTLVQLEPDNMIFWGDLGVVQYDLGALLLESEQPAEREAGRKKLRSALQAWDRVRHQAPQQFERLHAAPYSQAEAQLLDDLEAAPAKTSPTL